MIYLLNWRLWVLGILLAIGPIGYVKGRTDGKRIEKAEWVASVAAANAEALHLERARQSRVDEAVRTAAAREASLRAAAAGARGELGGLRGDLDAARRYAAQSRAAAERVAGLATDLFRRCTARYLGVAEAAQRADSEARELRQGWITDHP